MSSLADSIIYDHKGKPMLVKRAAGKTVVREPSRTEMAEVTRRYPRLHNREGKSGYVKHGHSSTGQFGSAWTRTADAGSGGGADLGVASMSGFSGRTTTSAPEVRNPLNKAGDSKFGYMLETPVYPLVPEMVTIQRWGQSAGKARENGNPQRLYAGAGFLTSMIKSDLRCETERLSEMAARLVQTRSQSNSWCLISLTSTSTIRGVDKTRLYAGITRVSDSTAIGAVTTCQWGQSAGKAAQAEPSETARRGRESVMIQSDLHGDMKRGAEMCFRLA